LMNEYHSRDMSSPLYPCTAGDIGRNATSRGTQEQEE